MQEYRYCNKPADKGGGMAIMPRALYNQEALCQLESTTYYWVLASGTTAQFQKEIETFLLEEHAHLLISDKETGLLWVGQSFTLYQIKYIKVCLIHQDNL